MDLNEFKAQAELVHKIWIQSLLNLDPEFVEANGNKKYCVQGALDWTLNNRQLRHGGSISKKSHECYVVNDEVKII